MKALESIVSLLRSTTTGYIMFDGVATFLDSIHTSYDNIYLPTPTNLALWVVIATYLFIDTIYHLSSRVVKWDSIIHHILVFLGVAQTLYLNTYVPAVLFIIGMYECITCARFLEPFVSVSTFVYIRIFLTCFIRVPLTDWALKYCSIMRSTMVGDYRFPSYNFSINYWEWVLRFVYLFDMYCMYCYAVKLYAERQKSDSMVTANSVDGSYETSKNDTST